MLIDKMTKDGSITSYDVRPAVSLGDSTYLHCNCHTPECPFSSEKGVRILKELCSICRKPILDAPDDRVSGKRHSPAGT